jgi:tRNA A-37 threonylcarbamoyl transferase component Bud32
VVSGDDYGAAGGLITGLASGSRIAGFRLEELIGQGGMAVVYRARDEQLGRLVALKILAPTLARDAEFRRRFSSEWRAAAAIDDPNIVPVFAAGEADDKLFIAMRYVAGGDAQSLLSREGPLPPGRVVAIVSPVASALDAAHRAGLVHRDVKPSNMLIDVVPGRPDHIYLSDFGLSKAAASTSGITREGEVLGTLPYMSPEQIGGKPVDGRADQYALACSAFELLVGVPPFPRDEPAAVMYAHMSEPPPQLTSLRPGLPPAVDGVLSRALAKTPGERYTSCGQFADALRDAFGFHRYRPGPGGMAEAGQPPTEVRGTGDGPATGTTIPTVPDAITDAGESPAGTGGGRAMRPRRLRRRIAVAAVILAAAGLAAGLLLPGGPAATTVVPVSVKSALPAVSGDVYVEYLGGALAKAEVYGKITKATNGEVAALYAQQFPYKNAPAQVSSVILRRVGDAASYSFPVTPTLATRYRVELFQNSTASTPLGTSSVATIYVVASGTAQGAQECTRPVCSQSQLVTEVVPPSALQTEASAPQYVYFGINLAPSTEPAVPQWLMLGAGNGHSTTPRRISADEFIVTITFSFRVGSSAFHFAWDRCGKSNEAADGVGLPGHHGCGDQRVLQSARYLG